MTSHGSHGPPVGHSARILSGCWRWRRRQPRSRADIHVQHGRPRVRTPSKSAKGLPLVRDQHRVTGVLNRSCHLVVPSRYERTDVLPGGLHRECARVHCHPQCHSLEVTCVDNSPTCVHQFAVGVSSLPAELNKNLTLMGELDARASGQSTPCAMLCVPHWKHARSPKWRGP
eukprot:SAG11_NODE_734_length_7466_cov_3.388625_1_plen_172_part_00